MNQSSTKNFAARLYNFRNFWFTVSMHKNKTNNADKTSLRRLVRAFLSIDTPEKMNCFFDEIFTKAEVDDFTLRWRLMELLHQGRSQREVASELGISLCKVTRGAKILRNQNSITSKILNQNN